MSEKILVSIEIDSERAIKEITRARTEISALRAQNKALKDSGRELSVEYTQNAEKIKILNSQIRENSNTLKQASNLQRANKGSLAELRAEVALLNRQYVAMKGTERELSAEGLKLKQTLEQKTRALKDLEGAVGNNRRRVGDYKEEMTKALQTSGGFGNSLVRLGDVLKNRVVLGFTAAIAGAGAYVKLMSEAVKKAIEFQASNAKLASVLGVTRKEVEDLTNDARRLGATTAFTATQVTQLQTEFAKFGFSKQEIKDATEATIQLAVATGSDLVQASQVAAATVRGFGLDTTETQRVVDVMAKSFSSSALDINKFQTAMAILAPVAKNAGQSIEQTTAQLGLLTDRGVDASTAGTALRTILLKLASEGKTLEQALNEVRGATDKNAKALELFGLRGAVAGTILAENGEAAENLTKKLENAGGAAQKMAETQLDSLEGKLTLLSSAWEGFLLGLENGEGLLGRLIGRIVDFSSAILNFLTPALAKESELLEEERFNMNLLFEQLKDERLEKERRAELVEELNSKYGDYLKNLIDEETAIGDIAEAQKAANEEFLRGIKIKVLQEELEEKVRAQREAQKKRDEILAREAEAKVRRDQAKANLASGNVVRATGADDLRFGSITQAGAESVTEQLASLTDEEIRAKFREELDKADALIKELTEDANELLNEINLAGPAPGSEKKEKKTFFGGGLDEGLTDKERKAALRKAREAIREEQEAELLELELGFQARELTEQEFNEARINTEIKYFEKEKALLEEHGENVSTIERKILEARGEFIDLRTEEYFTELEALYDAEEKALAESFERGEINKKQYSERLLDIELRALEAELELRRQIGEDVTELETEIAEKRAEIREKGNEKILEDEKRAQKSLRELFNGLTSVFETQNEEKQAALEESLEKGLVTQDEYNQKSKELQEKAGTIYKVQRTGQAIADTFTAANRALAELPTPFNFIASALAVATGLANVAQIQRTKLGKFAKGGLIEIGGKSHAQGGTKFYGEDGTEFEAEEGELLAVINKRSAGLLRTLSSLNQLGGGLNFFGKKVNFAADGGIIARNASRQVETTLTNEALARAIGESLGRVQIVTKVSDINRTQEKTAQIKQASRL